MNKIAIKYAIILFVGLLGFFLITRAIGITDNNTLLIFTAVLELVIVYFAIKEYRLSGKSSVGNYLSGVSMGALTVALGAFAFSVFMYIYLSADPSYMKALESDAEVSGLQRQFMTPMASSGVLFGVAIGVGVIGSYILTRIIDMNISGINTNVNSPD